MPDGPPSRRPNTPRPAAFVTYLTEPAFSHDRPGRTAVLLVNLGTPDAPEPGPVRTYLKEFLSDPRVVEIPRLVWWPILNGIILTVRPRKSAAKYATIWTPQGSPLKHWSEQQALLLRGYLGERGLDLDVALAMRYGNPSIADVLAQLREQGVERLLLLPLYPQYSATTTATVFDAVHRVLAQTRNVPEVRWVKHFHDHPRYIEALAQQVRAYWTKHGRAQDVGGKLVMSFHGVPRRTLELGDPYHCECHKTGRLLAQALGLGKGEYVVSFQSRFGKAEWLQPYTAPLLEELGRGKARRVDVVCPGFVADCLETLEEIAMEGKEEFRHAGGGDYHYIDCLNDAPAFIHALAQIVEDHTQGWPTARSRREQRAAEAAQAAQRALELGAPR
jgi:protoporphyrin/coproporphyrin ferrochelatase